MWVYDRRMMIAKIRKAKGLTQVELASIAGIEQASVSRAERGFEGTTLRIIKAIADALEVSPSQLLSDEREVAEERLIQAYRNLSPDHQAGWMQLALALTESH